jgi:hypothetical protein
MTRQKHSRWKNESNLMRESIGEDVTWLKTSYHNHNKQKKNQCFYQSSDNHKHLLSLLIIISSITSTINIGEQCHYEDNARYQKKNDNELVDKSIADYRWSLIFFPSLSRGHSIYIDRSKKIIFKAHRRQNYD